MSDSEVSSSSDDEVVQTRRFTHMSAARMPVPSTNVLPAKKKSRKVKNNDNVDVRDIIQGLQKQEKRCKLCGKKKATRKCIPCKHVTVCGNCSKKAYKEKIKKYSSYMKKIEGLDEDEIKDVPKCYLPSCLACDVDVQSITKVVQKRVVKLEDS